MKTAEVLLNW